MMPLIVKDFTWHQTPTSISIVVPIRGVRGDKTDILTSKNYIRIHFHPYIFEAFLFSEVDDIDGGNCTIDSETGSVLIQLPKVNPKVEWPSLEVQGLDREQKKTIREQAVRTIHERHEEQAKVTAGKRTEQRQLSVREQIRMDDESRQRIAAIKRAESDKALAEMKQWTENNQMVAGQTVSHVALPSPTQHQLQMKEPFQNRLAKSKNTSQIFSQDHEDTLEQLIEKGPTVVDILGNGDYCQDSFQKVAGGAAKYLEEKCIWPDMNSEGTLTSESKVPAIREQAHISVTFTPREFPTPARESNSNLEEEWLKKQAEAIKTQGFNDADLRPEERDPFWLLDKGKSLMKSECFLGAVSAFSLAMKMAPKMPELYVQRGMAQLALRNFIKSVEDASYGLELLTPKVAANAEDRLKCHLTRGTGFQQLNMVREGLMDLKEAQLLQPKNPQVIQQINELEAHLQRDEQSSSDEED